MSSPEARDAAKAAAIRFDRITKAYRGANAADRSNGAGGIGKAPQYALDNLSLACLEGQCTGIMGHNGAGKTTAIKLLLGLIHPTSGRVSIFQKPPQRANRTAIGYMPETNKLSGTLTPEELLKGHLRLYDQTRRLSRIQQRALLETTLDTVGLFSYRHHPIRKLSKGMARRVAWAQATIHTPKLLILDEPSSGLDPAGRLLMDEWILAQKQRGTTVILCTHDLQQVRAVCDDFHILNRGRLVLTTVESCKNADSQSGVQFWPQESKHNYNVHISGADLAALKIMGDEEQLPPWQEIKQQGFLAILSFLKYADAAAWLTASIRRDLVVVKFGDESGDKNFAANDELIRCFTPIPHSMSSEPVAATPQQGLGELANEAKDNGNSVDHGGTNS